jgi:hypothetical protein
MPDLAGSHQVIHAGHLHRLGDPAVQTVYLVEIDPVGAEPLEACAGGASHTFAGESQP